jgi:hypothetical protein
MSIVKLAGLTALALILGTFAQSEAQQEQSVRVEGCGTVIGGDIAQAKDEALIDARVKALEQVSGVLLEAETLTQNEALFDAVVRSRASGYIKSERIVGEGRRPDGRYCVQVEAWVIPGDLREKLQSIVSELSIVVVLPETNMGSPNAPALVEGEIVQHLADANYRVFDPERVQSLRKREVAEAARRGDVEESRRIALRFLANIIITGEVQSVFSQNNAGIVSAHARGTVRAIEAETGRIIATVTRDGVRGFALSDEQAGRKALAEFGKAAVASLLPRLDEHFKRKDRLIEVRVRGLADENALARFKSFLQALRWVQDVQQRSFAPAEALLTLTYPEKTVYLASRMSREQGFRLVEFDRARIVVEVGK